jgi:hypothetical protein
MGLAGLFRDSRLLFDSTEPESVTPNYCELSWLFQSGMTSYGKVIGQPQVSAAIVISKAYPNSKDF